MLSVLACFASLGASGKNGDPFQEAIKPNADRTDRSWKRFRNPQLGYCVSYPSRWNRGAAFDGSGLFVEAGAKIGHSNKPAAEIDIGPMAVDTSEDARLEPARLTGEEDLVQDVKEHLADLKRFVRAERLEVLDQHSLTVQGSHALYLKDSYYDALERSHWVEELVFVQHQGQVYRLEMHFPPEQEQRFEPVFAYLVNSFELDCK